MRYLFIHFSYNFLVFPVKKSDIDMNDKRLIKSYKSHSKPQSSQCLVVHEDAHPSYKKYKIKKPYFIGHSRYTSTSIHNTLFCIFQFSFLLWKEIKKKKNSHAEINKCKTMQCMKA